MDASNKNQSLPISEWAAGIWRIEFPFGFSNVNAFLIEDERLTLIDSGPPYQESNDLLLSSLQQLGYSWEDIDFVIMTHPHVDHIGGIAKLPDYPEVYAYKGTQKFIGSYDGYIESVYFTLYGKLASEYPELANKIMTDESEQWMRNYYCMGGDVRIDKEFTDGEIINLGKRNLRVVHTPGHHALHMSLYLEEEKIFFSGDYVLRGGPQLSRLLGDDIEAFQKSVYKIKQLEIDKIFPSHGKILDLEKGLFNIENLVNKQKEKIRNALRDGGKNAEYLFNLYIGRQVPNEMVGIYFAGLDTFLHALIKSGEVIKENGKYYLKK